MGNTNVGPHYVQRNALPQVLLETSMMYLNNFEALAGLTLLSASKTKARVKKHFFVLWCFTKNFLVLKNAYFC